MPSPRFPVRLVKQSSSASTRRNGAASLGTPANAYTPIIPSSLKQTNIPS
jgi:hypothetical protein